MKYSLDHVELLKKHKNSLEFKLTLHRQNERGTIIIKTNDSITQNKLIHKKFQIDLKKEVQKLSGGSTDLGKLTFNLKEQLYVLDNNCFVYDIEGKQKEKAIVFKKLPDSKRSVVGIYNTETFSLQLSVIDSDKLIESGNQKCEEFFKTLLTSAQSTPTTQTIQTVLPTQRATLPVPTTQTATAVPTTQLATPPTVQTPTVVLETMPFVNENGESQTENAEEELRGILTTVQRYLALIIGNRTSEFYIEDIKNSINEILEKNELTDKEKSTNLLPKLKNFFKDVIDTKDMKDKDPWKKKKDFEKIFNDVQNSILEQPEVLEANDLKATLTTLFGKNPAVLKGYEEKAKRIGAATYKKSKVAYEHYLPQLKSREKESTQIKKINALDAYKKKIGDFACNSNVEKNISSVEKIDYSTMKLILGSEILMLPEYPDIDTLNQDSPKFISATLGHYMNYLKLNSDVQITLGASVTSKDGQGWFFMQNKNKTFKIFTNDCVLKGNNTLVDKKIEAGKSELMTIRNALSKEFDRVTGNIAIAKKTTAGNLMRSDEDRQRIDLMSQAFLYDDVLIMDPIICLMILYVFPKVKHKTYYLDGKCLFEGCSEQWGTENNNTKDYYMRNAVHFFELNYNVSMDDFGTEEFGKVQLEGEGDVRTMKYKIKWRGDLKTVDINVCPIPGLGWDDGLYRLCGPEGESVKDHYWDMPKQPTKPTVRTEDGGEVYITPGEMDVLKKIKTYHKGQFVESINFKRNPLGYYDKNKNDGNLVWFPAQPNKEEKIQISKRKPSLTFRFVDVLDRESEMSNEITLPVIEQVKEEKEEVEEEEKKVEKEQEVEEKKVEEASPPVDKYAKYLKMQKMGIPLSAVKQKMIKDGISTEEITKFENIKIKGGDIENVTLNLIVPIKDVITKEILMENVPTSTTITALKEMILEKLKSENIMQEYYVWVNRKGYNTRWNEFMISVSQWKEKINYTGYLMSKEVNMNAELKKTYKRNDIVDIVGKGSEDFVDWILKNVPCVIGNRHYTNLLALLQKTREETTGETKGETNEETNLMKERLEKIDSPKIDKILNGTFKKYKDIDDNDTKRWLKGLIESGLWKCDDPDNKNAKFNLEKIRDEARKYVWKTKKWDPQKIEEWAKEMGVDTDQCELLLPSIFSIEKGIVKDAILRNMGGKPSGPTGVYKIDENYKIETTKKFKEWVDKNFSEKKIKWRDVKYKLMRKLVPQKWQ